MATTVTVDDNEDEPQSLYYSNENDPTNSHVYPFNYPTNNNNNNNSNNHPHSSQYDTDNNNSTFYSHYNDDDGNRITLQTNTLDSTTTLDDSLMNLPPTLDDSLMNLPPSPNAVIRTLPPLYSASLGTTTTTVTSPAILQSLSPRNFTNGPLPTGSSPSSLASPSSSSVRPSLRSSIYSLPPSKIPKLTDDADCGSSSLLYLSYVASRKYKEKHHPRIVTVGLEAQDALGAYNIPTLHYQRYSLRKMNTGYHPFFLPRVCSFQRLFHNWCCCCGQRLSGAAKALLYSNRIQGDLVPYGAGVVLYFKFLKTLAILCGILSLLALPSLLLFYSGDGFSLSNYNGLGKEKGSTAISALSWFTLGNLGEATISCTSGYEYSSSNTLTLTCPTGSILRSVEAAYGTPQGECTCPSARTPAPACPGSPIFTTGIQSSSNTQLCDPPGSYCQLADVRTVNLPSGANFRTGSCCSRYVDDSKPWFGDLDISYNYISDLSTGTASVVNPNSLPVCQGDPLTINRIVRGLCVGKQTCTVNLQRNITQVWKPTSVLSTVYSTIENTVYGLSDTSTTVTCPPYKTNYLGYCFDSLQSNGNFNGCTEDSQYNSLPYSYRNSTGMRMVLVGKCYTTSLSIGWLSSTLTASKNDVAVVTMVTNFFIAIGFILTVWLLHVREGQTTDNYVSASDYTVMLTDLPPHTSLQQLKEDLVDHFETLLTSVPRVSSIPLLDKGKIYVADINFGLENTRTLRLFKARGKLLRQLERIGRIELIEGTLQHPDEQKLARILVKRIIKQLKICDQAIDAYEILEDNSKTTKINGSKKDKSKDKSSRQPTPGTQLESTKRAFSSSGTFRHKDAPNAERATAAFITFAEEEGALRALATYPSSYIHWLCQSRSLRFQNRYRIWLTKAPEPSDIVWENLAVSNCNRYVRRIITGIFLFIIILVAAYLVFLTEDAKRNLSRAYPDVSCSALLATGIGTWNGTAGSSSSSGVTVTTNSSSNLLVGSPDWWFSTAFPNNEAAEGYGGFAKGSVIKDVYWKILGYSTGNMGLLGCYCSSLWINQGGTALFNEDFPIPSVYSSSATTNGTNNSSLYPELVYTGDTNTLCQSWLSTYVSVMTLTYGSSLVTLGINLILTAIIYILVYWEKHWNKTSELRVRGLYLFILQFVNTGALILLLNAYISTDFSLLRNGQYPDFQGRWYSTVGLAIALTMLINTILPHFGPLFLVFIHSCYRCTDRSCTCDRSRTKKFTQTELNTLQLGPEFSLDTRYAQAYNAIFVCLAYGTGIPLLLPILFVTLLIMYWFDKLLFIQAYTTPPKYNATLPRTFTALLPIAIVFYLSLGAWMLSNDDIFPSQTNINDTPLIASLTGTTFASGLAWLVSYDPLRLRFGTRITSIQVLPLVLLCIVIVVILLIVYLLLGLLFKVFVFFCPCANARVRGRTDEEEEEDDGDEEENEKNLSCTRSCYRGCCACRCWKASSYGKNLPSYFLAIPPDEVQAVATGLRFVKPHLKYHFDTAHEVQSKAEARLMLGTLVTAFETAQDAAREASNVYTRLNDEVQRMKKELDDLLDNGVVPPSTAQIKAEREVIQLEEAKLLARHYSSMTANTGFLTTMWQTEAPVLTIESVGSENLPNHNSSPGTINNNGSSNSNPSSISSTPSLPRSSTNVIIDGMHITMSPIDEEDDDGDGKNNEEEEDITEVHKLEDTESEQEDEESLDDDSVESERMEPKSTGIDPRGTTATMGGVGLSETTTISLPSDQISEWNALVSSSTSSSKAEVPVPNNTSTPTVLIPVTVTTVVNVNGRGNPFDSVASVPVNNLASKPLITDGNPFADTTSTNAISSTPTLSTVPVITKPSSTNPFGDNFVEPKSNTSLPKSGSVSVSTAYRGNPFADYAVSTSSSIPSAITVSSTVNSLISNVEEETVPKPVTLEIDTVENDTAVDIARSTDTKSIETSATTTNASDPLVRLTDRSVSLTEIIPVTDRSTSVLDQNTSEEKELDSEPGTEQSIQEGNNEKVLPPNNNSQTLSVTSRSLNPFDNVLSSSPSSTAPVNLPNTNLQALEAARASFNKLSTATITTSNISSNKNASSTNVDAARALVRQYTNRSNISSTESSISSSIIRNNAVPSNPFGENTTITNNVPRQTSIISSTTQPVVNLPSSSSSSSVNMINTYDTVSVPLPSNNPYLRPAPLSPSQRKYIELQDSIRHAQYELKNAARTNYETKYRANELQQKIMHLLDTTTVTNQGNLVLDSMSSDGNGARMLPTVSSPVSSLPVTPTTTTTNVTVAETKYISGVWSYDLHDNRAYATLFGLDTEVEDIYKRRMAIEGYTEDLGARYRKLHRSSAKKRRKEKKNVSSTENIRITI